MGGGPLLVGSSNIVDRRRGRRGTPNKWAHGYDGQMAGMLEAANISKPWWWIKDKEADNEITYERVDR